MNDLSKDNLISFMNFTSKLKSADATIIDDINHLTDPKNDFLTDSNISIIEEIVVREFYSNLDLTFVLETIDKIPFVDQDYLKAMGSVRDLEFSSKTDEVKQKIKDTILNVHYTFKKSEHEFSYYHALSRIVVTTSDPELIKLAIDKVQSL